MHLMWSRRAGSHSPQEPSSIRPAAENFAVPLTPQQADVLVAGLNEDVRLTRLHTRDPDGGEFSRDEADYIRRTANVAAQHGHATIPLLTDRIRLYKMVLDSLKQWASESDITRRFTQLHADLLVLREMARAHGWTAAWGPAAQWDGTPPAAPNLTR